MEFLAVQLQNAGYHVYIPLNPGHGLPIGQCTGTGVVCVDNYRVDQLPATKAGYVNFATWAVDMIKEDMAIYATSRAAGFTTVLVNPFFSAADPSFDHSVQTCQSSAAPTTCMNNFVNTLIGYDATAASGTTPNTNGSPIGFGTILNYFKSKAVSAADWLFTNAAGTVLTYHYPDFMRTLILSLTDLSENGGASLSFTTSKFGWGAGCIANTARAGICSFQIKHLMAVNAVGMYSVSRAKKIKGAHIAYMGTVRDGFMREGVIYATANAMQAAGNTVSFCLYFGAAGCADIVGSNSCGVPHSCMSRAENYYNEPYTLYWETDLFNNIVGYIGGSKATIGTAGTTAYTTCGAIALNNQPAYASNIAAMAQIVADANTRWPN
ncbi:hypothetical protein HDU76_007582 [Blyttiomyces sp. JEL0837]|nr:hypothetical protein HDU76_007582 [Blyttiomyces sp. JEL0837]